MTSRLPTGLGPTADLTLYQLGDDPYPALARLRAHAPVAWLAETGMWLVTRRDDVVRVLRDPATFTTDDSRSPIQDIFGRQMLSVDGVEQKRYKAACARSFSKRTVRDDLHGLVAAKVDRLLFAMAWRGQADLRRALTGPLAVFAVAAVLGIPPELEPTILAWYDQFARALANFTGDPAARLDGLAAATEFRAAMRPLLAQARAGRSVGLLGTMVGADAGLADEAVLANALIVLFGGIETTDAMMANAIWALLTHPDQLRLVREDPSLIPNAIEESLRWEPAVQSCTRYTAGAATLGEVALQPGEAVQCMLGAANRDPAYFVEPDRFDVRRPNAAEHLSFGLGHHLCLGAHLAREEGTVAVAALLERLPGLRLDPEWPVRPTGYEFRKPAALRVRWQVEGGRAGS